ncbi:cyclase family protein [Clostridium cylindrosporum]|uniref:Putative metal-dependent hydrolase n=1 Tax=Clostridium cylindrosporum DSM 605 TaxID=1121307 RepID=A0A0J8DCY0_CLOCY|nr:cyclase family protein [Clostridium cylindrosporum]KMT22114.1 putative metal-dependent hydrolase [Clostridium cylindrosporum DSM 605]
MALKLIDLSQEIYEGMPLFGIHQKTFFMTNQTHEQNMAATGSKTLGFYARNILMSEHCGTHSDAVIEYKPGGASIENMPLDYYWGSAICLDFSHKRYPDYIDIKDFEEALASSGLEIQKGDIVLMYTGNYNRNYGTDAYTDKYTGISYDAAKWLAEKGVVNIGVDAPAIDQTPDDLDFSGHLVCAEYDITNTEHLCNLDQVAGKRFLYIGLPLKIRGGTGSPIRAVALVEE